ncbi:hypothetical protein PFISCL1PPCAC_15342, partial [Pristionchus fissidentatus]
LRMAEINERASVSQPSSPPPGPTHEIAKLADEAQDRLSALLHAQISSTVEEYKLIEEMNKVTAKRYEDMKIVAEGVGEKLKKLDISYDAIRPYLRQVHELDEGTKRLEDALTKMENYVTNLEQKLSNLKLAREQQE